MDDELIYIDFIEPVVNSPQSFVPIIGEDMYVVGDQSLQEYLFSRFAADSRASHFREPILPRKEELLKAPYYEFLSKVQRSMHIPMNFPSIYWSIIDKATKEGTLTLRADVLELLEEAGFPLILTTLCWPVIESKVKSHKYTPMWHRWGQKEETNLEPIRADKHTVYHLLGQNHVKWVHNERTLLDCLHSHQNTDNSLSKYLKDCRLLCFGCHLPNWIFRFLWYPMTKLKDEQYPNSMSEGLWEQSDRSDDFDAFLSEIGYRRLQKKEGDTDVLNAYLKALTKAFNDSTVAEERSGEYKYDIFLSYKSEDKEVAKKIHQILTKTYGLVVWKDDDRDTGYLKLGGDYWERIRHGIENSRYFMPVVSKDYESTFLAAYHDEYLGEDSPIGVVKETYMALKHLAANEDKFKALDPKGILVYSLPVVDIDALTLDKVTKRIKEGVLPERFFKDMETYFFSDHDQNTADTFHGHDWSIYRQE